MRRQIIETFELAVPPEVAAVDAASRLRGQEVACRPRSRQAFAVAPVAPRSAAEVASVVCEVRAEGEGAVLEVLVDAAEEASRARSDMTVLALVVGTTLVLAMPVFGVFALTVVLPVMVGFAVVATRSLAAAREPVVRRLRRELAAAVGRAFAPVVRPRDPYRGEVEAAARTGRPTPAATALRVALPPAGAVTRAGELLAERAATSPQLRFHAHFDPCCFVVARVRPGGATRALVIASPEEGGSRLEVLLPADDLVLRAGLATAPIVAGLALVFGPFALHFMAPIGVALYFGLTRLRGDEAEREVDRAEIVAALEQGLAAGGRGAP